MFHHINSDIDTLHERYQSAHGIRKLGRRARSCTIHCHQVGDIPYALSSSQLLKKRKLDCEKEEPTAPSPHKEAEDDALEASELTKTGGTVRCTYSHI